LAAERQAEASILTGKAGAARLWATWLIGPVAWALHETGTYWLSTWMCSNGVLWLFHAATLVALMTAAAGAALAWRLLRYAEAPPPDHLTRTTELRAGPMYRHPLTIMLAAVLALATAAGASAHVGDAPAPTDAWAAWTFEWWVVAPTLLAAVLYGKGVWRLWSKARPGAGVRGWQVGAFAVGWLVLALSLTSPIDTLGQALFWVHMIQHELLILIAAPLLVLSSPQTAFLWALPRRWRHGIGGLARTGWWKRGWRALTNPLSAWAIHALLLWGWHVPPLFQASLVNELVHTLQHIGFFGSALLFWWSMVQAGSTEWGYGAAVLGVFTTALHSSALGALLTFASIVWYPIYAETAPLWGLSALEDQQLGGLIMWVPGGVVFLVAGLVLLACWLQEAERKVQRRDRRAWTGLQ
jgi:putative membrane protein